MTRLNILPPHLYQAVPAFKILTGLDMPDRQLLKLMRKALS